MIRSPVDEVEEKNIWLGSASGIDHEHARVMSRSIRICEVAIQLTVGDEQ